MTCLEPTLFKMFEAKFQDGTTLKKIVDAIKELVTDVNLDVSASGISLQAMDSSHVALVQLKLDKSGFATFRVDKPVTLGLSIVNLAKVMRLVGNNDSITLRCETKDEPQFVSIICESAKQERTTEFTLNLISLDSESLGIPETAY
jgi:proliferating cell nuclear antigen